jgi:WNK lysine deficient protein kinase
MVKLKVVKRWCSQILDGLVYLHSLHPPVIHRDIKCENMLYNSADGTITIGDLGLATRANREGTVDGSVSGTPNFMAPEMFDGEYDETVDVYSFGLCVLEMVTRTIPYDECANLGQIYMKLSAVRGVCGATP